MNVNVIENALFWFGSRFFVKGMLQMKKTLFLSVLMLVGCASSVTILKPGYMPQPPENVTMVLDNVKEYNFGCKEFEHIAIISTSWEWNGEIAINKAREETASVGGNIFVGSMFLNDFNDAQVSGNAYICIK